jgi:transposase
LAPRLPFLTCACAGLLRAKGFAERNRRLEVKLDRSQWSAATFGVFLLTSLSSENGVYVSNPTFGNNTGETFLNWVEECILTQVSSSSAVRSVAHRPSLQNLVRGDTLVCDNSRLHHAQEIVQDFHDLLDANGIRLVYMPNYSPELNPCELCFGRAKRYLRDERAEGEFVMEVAKGFARIDAPMVCSFYKKCIVDV